MKNIKRILIMIFLIIFVFTACTLKSIDRGKSEIVIDTKTSNNETQSQEPNEIIPEWCNAIMTPINEPEMEVNWPDNNSPSILSQLTNYSINNDYSFSRNTNISPNGEWIIISDGSKTNLVKTENGEKINIELPIGSGFNFLDYGPWSPDSSSVIMYGMKNWNVYDRSGIEIININNGGQITTKYFLLPNELSTEITAIWANDDSKIALLYFQPFTSNSDERSYLTIIDVNGNLLKTSIMPNGFISKINSKSEIIWNTDGIFFSEYSDIDKKYNIATINPEVQNDNYHVIYSSNLELNLLGVNSVINQILISEGSFPNKSCILDWNYLLNRQESTSFLNSSYLINSTNEDLINLEIMQDNERDSNYQTYMIYLWKKGPFLVKEDSSFSLGWNSHVNGLLFVRGDYPGFEFGFISP